MKLSKKQINYPKIVQFRQVVSNVKHKASFVGLDENGNPIYNKSLPKPVLKFHGTVKLHGTNAAVCFNYLHGMWYQSRTRIITPESDNAGFAFFAESKRVFFRQILTAIIRANDIDFTKNTISIYGEWAGKGVQKGVGISEFDKAFYIFGIKVSPLDETKSAYWIENKEVYKFEDQNIYNIESFPTFEIDIDFAYPEYSQNKMVEITEQVEKECPVAKQLGASGIGEGVVWSCNYGGGVLRFKVKGEKHSVSKVKKLKTVDVEKVKNIENFVEYAVTENRVKQACQEVFGIGVMADIQKLGEVIKWVVNDVRKEEMDIMVERNLTPKDTGKYIANKTRQIFNTIL